MRLIDAERFLERFLADESESYMGAAVILPKETGERVYCVTHAQINELVHRKLQMLIADAPEIDPVKHGSWVKLYPNETIVSKIWFNCSECNKLASLANAREWKFCPCCGARMDGKKDAAELKSYMKDCIRPDNAMDLYSTGYAEGFIDNAHTIDLVKHGEWKDINWAESQKLHNDIWSGCCTVCNKYSSWIGPHYSNKSPYNYCPNCGAKMDGESKIYEIQKISNKTVETIVKQFPLYTEADE